MNGKDYIYLENQAFKTVNFSFRLRAHFSPLLMFEFGSIRRCLPFPGKIHR